MPQSENKTIPHDHPARAYLLLAIGELVTDQQYDMVRVVRDAVEAISPSYLRTPDDGRRLPAPAPAPAAEAWTPHEWVTDFSHPEGERCLHCGVGVRLSRGTSCPGKPVPLAPPPAAERIESPEALVDRLVAKHVTDGDAIPAALVAEAIRKRDAQWDVVHHGMREGASDGDIAAMLDTMGPVEPMTNEKRERILREVNAAEPGENPAEAMKHACMVAVYRLGSGSQWADALAAISSVPLPASPDRYAAGVANNPENRIKAFNTVWERQSRLEKAPGYSERDAMYNGFLEGCHFAAAAGVADERERLRTTIRSLLDVIHDSMTHELQLHHQEEIRSARSAIGLPNV